MIGRWTVRPAKPLTFTLILAGLTACGGGSSSSGGSNGTGSQGSNERDATFNFAVTVPEYTFGEISEDNAEVLTIESFNTLTRIERGQLDILEDLTIQDGSQLSVVQNVDEIDYSAYLCDRGGSSRLRVNRGTLKNSAEGFLVFAAGDRYTTENIACASSSLRRGYQFQGVVTTRVITGLYYVNSGVASADAQIAIIYDQSGIAGDGLQDYYTHGDKKITVTDATELELQGESLSAYNNWIPDWGYFLGNYQLVINKLEGYPSYRSVYSMDSEGSFELGLTSGAKKFEANITSPIVFDDWLGEPTEGSYSLSSNGQTLSVEIFETHLMYRLDLDDDGIFEIETMIDLP